MNKETFDWRNDQKARRRVWTCWYNMKCRCEKPSTDSYHRYGGRGIKVCEEWHDFETFLNWAYESGYDPYAEFGECTLDRIDNNGDYCPENCKWSTVKEQTKNTSRNNLVTYNGETRPIIEWSEILGVPVMTMYKRSNLGMPPEKILYPGSLNGHKNIQFLKDGIDNALAKSSMSEAMK